MEMTLRNARREELAAVLAMYRAVIGLSGCTWDQDYPGEEELAADHAAGCLYVLRDGQALVGAVSVVPSPELDDLEGWHVCDGTQREIARVVIARDRQGHGYAKLMLTLLFARLAAQGCHGIRLLTAVGNAAALKTYQALGFAILGQCRRYEHQYYICEKALP